MYTQADWELASAIASSMTAGLAARQERRSRPGHRGYQGNAHHRRMESARRVANAQAAFSVAQLVVSVAAAGAQVPPLRQEGAKGHRLPENSAAEANRLQITVDELEGFKKVYKALGAAQNSWFKCIGLKADSDFTVGNINARLTPDRQQTRTYKALTLLRQYEGDLKNPQLLREIYDYGRYNQWGKNFIKGPAAWDSTRLFFDHAEQNSHGRTAEIAQALGISR
ncbi:hypothetical protein PsalMR5_03690 [Piscirickettsia salmonis]|uniref:hypothetical protein n=2 Tax=Piscirickettsia salmonis TaxID=1238 RepID=UPI001E4D3C80|nr:hypothetical protein [Piscirickettsia salmonis]QGP56209.1 hypothetical protein PsalSR1_03685 [Piscirickettsia salmonis]QGP57915.1 hypothetical protein PsalBI1_00462 [Piscirickettsia salmonis]QGP65778.1 hypothetical protein PsalMR5_03690 [Piscirickettsia salmonis]